MIVTAALCWFDEPLWQLEDCIRGLPTVADRVVAVDGGYKRYPGAKTSSPGEQAEVIRETANALGLECVIHVPKNIWAGQVAKRSFTLQLATAGMSQSRDWFMAVDADHIWSGSRTKIRAQLGMASLRTDGFHVPMFTPDNPKRDIKISAAGEWHEKHAGEWKSPQRIFRCFPDPRVEKYHWWYSARKNHQRIWLWGGDRSHPHAKIRRLRAPFMVEHRCLFREVKQIKRNRAFCDDRAEIVKRTGQEDWV